MSAEAPVSPEDLIAAQYKGAKEPLRPLLDAIVHIARRIDPKVKVEPTASFVRFAKKQPFAVLKAVGKDRVELALALGEVPITPGVKPCRGLAGEPYVTHKLTLLHLSQVNAQLVIWFKRAYELTGTRSPPKPVDLTPLEEPEFDADAEVGFDDAEPEEPRVPNPPPARTRLKRSAAKETGIQDSDGAVEAAARTRRRRHNQNEPNSASASSTAMTPATLRGNSRAGGASGR